MRRAARVDDNHKEIVRVLRQIGCTVLDLSSLGGGVPDIAVGRNGRNYFLEIKDGDKPPSRRKLNQMQIDWQSSWGGQVATVCTAEDALMIINSVQRGLE